jgi:hypothetical protein
MYSTTTRWTTTAFTFSRVLMTARSSNFQSFSTKSLLRAAASKKPLFNVDALKEIQRSPAFEKLSKNPDAILAFQKMTNVMEKQGVFQLDHYTQTLIKSFLGVDLSLGKPPSMIQVSKLFMNSEFRKGAEELVEELKKTGVDADSKVGGLRQ